MQLQKYLVALVVFSVVLTAGLLIIPDMNENYADAGVNMSVDDFSNITSTLDVMYNTTQEMKEDTLGGEADDTETWESMVKGAYSAVRLISNSFTLVADISAAIASVMGIPRFIVDALITIITLMVIFALIYLIFRFKG